MSTTQSFRAAAAHDQPQSQWRSAMYRGTVHHYRFGEPSHRFSYRVAMPLLFLDEVDAICAASPMWSSSRRAPVEFREADFLAAERGSGASSLGQAVVDVVEARNLPSPKGAIAVLANLRSFGWQFNPIALYFCFDETGKHVESVVAEVTNTPWKQRHCYVVGEPGEHRFAKRLHVSPFMTMDYEYRFAYSAPAQSLRVSMSNYREDSLMFRAALDLARVPITASESNKYALRAMAPRVSFAIYRQALYLKSKGVPFITHPNRARDEKARDERQRYESV